MLDIASLDVTTLWLEEPSEPTAAEPFELVIQLRTRTCKRCGIEYPVGPYAQRWFATGRREDAVFCSLKCQTSYKNAKKHGKPLHVTHDPYVARVMERRISLRESESGVLVDRALGIGTEELRWWYSR